MKIHISFVLLSLILLSFGLQGQPGKGKLKLSEYEEKANQLILLSNYDEAAKYLERIVSYEPQNTILLYQLAEAYRMARNSEQAAKYYGKVLKYSDDSVYLNYPLILFYYGDAVMKTGNYTEAATLLRQFQRNYKGSEESYYKNWSEILISGCEWAIRENHIRTDVELDLLDKTVNSGKTEYSPVLIQEDVLMFSSLRQDNPGSEFSYGIRSSIYTSQFSGEKWLKPVPFQGPFRHLDDHIGHGSFSPDKDRFYFTICTTPNNAEPHCAIYFSEVDGSSWSEPIEISTVNIAGYKSTSPFVTHDGLGTERIYFSSNRPGGEGGMDIWYVIRDAAGNFTTAQNLGSSVNTNYNEVTPFVNKRKNVFYFSSDGYQGFGGQDIYSIQYEGEPKGVPRNLGRPFNSSYDDVYYIENSGSDGGFLVSNRASSLKVESNNCCDNIFSFTSYELVLTENNNVLTGKVFGMDGQETFVLDDVLVQWFEIAEDGSRVWVDEVYAFNSEPFEFIAEKNKDYEILIEKSGYEKETFTFPKTLLNASSNEYSQDFFLRSEGNLIRGVVYGQDNKQKKLLENVEMKVYRVKSPGQVQLIKTMGFDQEGFRTTLSDAFDYRIIFTRPDYLVGSLWVLSDDLKSKHIPEFQVALLKRQIGLSTVIPGVEFEPGSIDLNASSLLKLDFVADFLNDNSGVEIEIGAFTDNQGTPSSNKTLSEKRANAVIAYLMGKGVNPERLSAKGYGESNPIVENTSEENRKKNRRIEMKITKISR